MDRHGLDVSSSDGLHTGKTDGLAPGAVTTVETGHNGTDADAGAIASQWAVPQQFREHCERGKCLATDEVRLNACQTRDLLESLRDDEDPRWGGRYVIINLRGDDLSIDFADSYTAALIDMADSSADASDRKVLAFLAPPMTDADVTLRVHRLPYGGRLTCTLSYYRQTQEVIGIEFFYEPEREDGETFSGRVLYLDSDGWWKDENRKLIL